jgi:CheY-like chemotaxis protein
MLTHELRNPLAPIRNAIQVIGHIPGIDPKLQAMHQTIDRQSAHLAKILDDMMDVARISRGKLAIESKPVDLAEVVERAVESTRPAIEAGKHQLKIDLPVEPVVVNGDVHRLTQLLSNLLNNSVRYSPSASRIVVAVHAEARNAVIRVKDTGRGIEKDNLERIFNMFIQGKQANSPTGVGLGIGLALARNIAQLHEGSLSAFSEGPNQGSEFKLTLPLIKGDANAQTAKPKEAISSTPKRVLVVDDNIDAAKTLELLLMSSGHKTCVAYDGIEAIKIAGEFHPDIVLLDLGMPGIDGYETARRLLDLKKERRFQIIAVTGWGQESDRQKTREAGFDSHLVKPIDLDDLTKAMGTENNMPRTLH